VGLSEPPSFLPEYFLINLTPTRSTKLARVLRFLLGPSPLEILFYHAGPPCCLRKENTHVCGELSLPDPYGIPHRHSASPVSGGLVRLTTQRVIRVVSPRPPIFQALFFLRVHNTVFFPTIPARKRNFQRTISGPPAHPGAPCASLRPVFLPPIFFPFSFVPVLENSFFNFPFPVPPLLRTQRLSQ